MRNFILNHRKILFILLIVLISAIISTVAITSFNSSRIEKIDKLTTCSKPVGDVVSKGLDVSSYQLDIDFNKVKADGFDFVILRVGTGIGKDKNFETYYQQATDAGLDIGCYYYSYAKNTDEARKEAKKTLQYIKGKTFSYPVFFDFEESDLLTYERTNLNTKLINTFCKTIKRAGYYPGVYMSSSTHRDFVNNEKIDSNWDVWIAEYGDYSGIDNNDFRYKFSMWQFSDKGSVNGIETNVDMNLCFVDYPAVIAEFKAKYDKI